MNHIISRTTAVVLGVVTTTFSIPVLPTYAQTATCASSGQTPVTSSYLREIARQRGIINNTMSTLTQNRRIGRAFQEFVQRSMQYPRENGYLFTSPARDAAARRATVRPDFTERVVNTDGRVDDHGSFVEVKATGSVLLPSYYYYQILGHINAVSRRPAATYRPGAARVLFITTSDTSAGPTETLAEANRSRVSIWKAIVCSTAQPGGSLQVGPATVLNPGVYGTAVPANGLPGLLNDLAQPGTAPAGYEDADGGY